MPNRPYCISYPKSGRTWLRVMLASLPATSEIVFQHDRFEFNDGGRPEHNFDVGERLNAYPTASRVVYLERDPRDVLVSLFHQVTGRFKDFFDYEGSLSDFIRDDYFGAMPLARFRQMWAVILQQRPFLKITYEEMHADASSVLHKVLAYLGTTVSQADIVVAIKAGDLETMRASELSGAYPEPWLRPRMGHTKVRRGVVGSHKTELTAEDVAYLNRVFQLD